MLAKKETPWWVGTSYGDAGGYPMTSTLNTWGRTGWYTTQPGTGHDATFTEAKYNADLVLDIDIGYPTATDVYEQANTGPHLTNHKPSIIIKHWVAGYGYASTGATTRYADSVHGVSTTIISWAGGVPAYWSLPSTSFFTLIGPFGVMW